jgi:hypothetical protein
MRPSCAPSRTGSAIVIHLKYLLLCPLLAVASFNATACYTVYDRANRIVYQGEEAPVDMSRPIHETLPARYPGGQLVFDSQTECAAIDVRSRALAYSERTTSPLLTDASNARAMRAPYTLVERNVALVQPQDARMAPGLTVIPPDTSAMGAGRARSTRPAR